MCCRYHMETAPALRPITEEAQRSRLYTGNREKLGQPLVTEGEIFPGALVPVIAMNRAGRRAVFPMIWGYRVQGVQHLVANARSETAAEKQSFRESWATHRCAIPASWY